VGVTEVRVITTPVPNQPLTSIEPISGDSRSSWASPFTSFSSTERIPGTFWSSSASCFISCGVIAPLASRRRGERSGSREPPRAAGVIGSVATPAARRLE
jgi:hypothetical protein